MATHSFHAHNFSYFQCLFMPFCCLFFHIFPSVHALQFNLTDFSLPSIPKLITKSGDAQFVNQKISLSQYRVDENIRFSVGRVTSAKELQLWDPDGREAANFQTHFSFNISTLNTKDGGDGFAFFIAPNGTSIPANSAGGCMGLVSNCSHYNASGIVAVEFDTYQNEWDDSDTHLGININSIRSAVTLNLSRIMKSGFIGHARINYNSQTKNLSVFLTYDENPIFNGEYSLSYQVNLSKILPERVTVGFSSATGNLSEMHYVLSWEFNSTEFPSNKRVNFGQRVAEVLGGCLTVVVVVGTVLILVFSKRNRREGKEESEQEDFMDQEFDHGSRPRRFSYIELVQATHNFNEGRKLGEGGFGGVYRGFLPVLNLNIAVKRVSKMSKQGRKEYMSEVKIISKLRHKNLVGLIGWCHEKGEFLLIYELMPHGSLDSHLFGDQNLLSWELRYKIALGLASALLYLHEESEQCVVHRDIKSSNVMLDSNFNAKLGDFGLARLISEESGVEMTALAGTFGYMAPEYISTGQVSKRSDVYSFGVVALEIASGRRSLEYKNEEDRVSLVSWVWDSYESGRLLEVADKKLSMEFDMEQMQCLMIVGLWCAQTDHNLRPPIRQALQVLNFEAPLPNLSKTVYVPNHSIVPIYLSSSSKLEMTNSAVVTGR